MRLNKRRSMKFNPSGHPLDQIITPKRMRRSVHQDEEVYAERVTHSKSKSSKVWIKYPPDIVLMDKLSSTLQECDPEVITIDDNDDDDDESEIIVDNVGEEKNVSYEVQTGLTSSKENDDCVCVGEEVVEEVICLGNSAQGKKRHQADKNTGARAKIPSKYNLSTKFGKHNVTQLSDNDVPTGYVGPPVYDTIFNDSVTRAANGKCSKSISSNSSVSEAEYTRFNPSTGYNCVSLLDKAIYRECLNSIVYPNDSIGADSPWPRKFQSSFSNRIQQTPPVIVDKMNDSGVYQRKTTNKIPVIDLTGLTENGNHLQRTAYDIEVVGSKSSASDNKYMTKTNGIDYLRKPDSASLPSSRGVLKANVPATQLAEGTGSGSKPVIENRRMKLDRKLYESCYLQDNYFSNLKEGYKASDKVISQQVLQEETNVRLSREKREAVFQDKIDKLNLSKLKAELTSLEVEVLPELTPDMLRRIEDALKPSRTNDVLVEAYNLPIRRKDMETLKGLNWLNDEIMNFYFTLLMERGKLDNYPSVYSFNTFFYPKLISGGHAALKRWTRRVDLFAYDCILIPVHLGMHWCLAVVKFKEKKIEYYDSMGGKNNQCLESIRKYLEAESLDKKKTKFDFSDWEFENVQDIPQQMNGSDCGMFSCKYAEYVSRNAKITFQQEDMPYFRNRMVYEILTNQLL